MNTYLEYLDDASLFQLLVRLHYPDLINLCKATPYLWKITCTPWFQESWKKYNVNVHDGRYTTEEVDTNGLKHGICWTYGSQQQLLSEVEYVQGLRCGTGKYWSTGAYFIDTFVMNKLHGPSAIYWQDKVEYRTYVAGLQQGLIKIYYNDGRIIWADAIASCYHGKVIIWRENGSIQQIEIYNNGEFQSGKYPTNYV